MIKQLKREILFFFFTRSTDYGDELTWAAAWLYKATKESQYLDDAEYMYMKYRLKERPNEFYYNKKVAGVQVQINLHSYLTIHFIFYDTQFACRIFIDTF